MEPIVSPWAIYWLVTISKIGAILIILPIALFGSILINWVIIWNPDRDEKEQTINKAKKRSPWLFLFLFISILLSLFCPSRETLIAMYATKYVTTDNVTKAIAAGKVVKDEVKKDVIDVITAIMNAKEESEVKADKASK
jgi:hypothetical protein